MSDWDRIFQLVKANDPYSRLRSIHNAFKMYNSSHLWVTHASIQNGSAVLDPERAVLYRDVWGKPVVYDSETVSGGTDRWQTGGGEFRGQSVPRLAFMRQIMDSGPAEGFEPVDKWQERRTGGKMGELCLVYFGEKAPTAWPFVLYKTGLADGFKFTVDVIAPRSLPHRAGQAQDGGNSPTWNMTITPLDGVYEIRKKGDYAFLDTEGRSIPLPAKPYMALRIRRVGPIVPVTPPKRDHET